jgi:hypothetical protein
MTSWRDGWMDDLPHGGMDGVLDGWPHGWMNVQMDGIVEGWMDKTWELVDVEGLFNT